MAEVPPAWYAMALNLVARPRPLSPRASEHLRRYELAYATERVSLRLDVLLAKTNGKDGNLFNHFDMI